jgi:hypothetical protein
MRSVDPPALLQRLSRRVNPFIPPSVRLSVDGAVITLANEDRAWTSFDCEDFLSNGSAEHTIERLLDHLQDFVSEEITEPWPSRANKEVLPLPVFLEGEEGFQLIYGSIQRTALRLNDLRW